MTRIINVVLLAVMIVGAVVTYIMKHQAEEAASLVARLHARVEKEKETIAELKAEWSLLTQPGRLQAAIARHADYFKLEPFSPSQVATLSELPAKPVAPTEDMIGKTLADAARVGQTE